MFALFQACIVRPVEDGQFEVFTTCQWMHVAQSLMAGALNISKNKIDVKVGLWATIFWSVGTHVRKINKKRLNVILIPRYFREVLSA